jgi:hypothetical protein
MFEIQNSKLNRPSTTPSPGRGEGRGEGGHLELVLGNYLGFVIWDLDFRLRQLFSFRR